MLKFNLELYLPLILLINSGTIVSSSELEVTLSSGRQLQSAIVLGKYLQAPFLRTELFATCAFGAVSGVTDQ